MNDRPAVIEAAHYGETRRRLVDDPLVIAMARGLKGVPLTELVHDVDDPRPLPRFEFMLAANREYASRNGGVGADAHIGGVAEALLIVLAKLKEAK